MLKDAIDSVGAFFSRSFLMGGFLPAFIVLVFNLVLAIFGLGAWDTVTFAHQGYKITSLATATSMVALASVSLAFIAAPFVPLLRRLVEGQLLPGFIRDPLVRAGEAAVKAAQATAMEWAAAHFSLSQALIANRKALAAARLTGQAVTGAPQPQAIAAAEAEVSKLSRALGFSGRRPAVDFGPTWTLAGLITAAAKVLEPALRQNHAGADAANSQPSDVLANRLDSAHVRYIALSDEALRQVSAGLSGAQNAIANNFAPGDVRATRFGNYCAVMEAYPQRAYGVAFDYIAPRLDLVLVVAPDGSSYDGFDRARTQVDSALMLLLLITLSLAGWLIGLAVAHRHLALFLALALAAPFLLWLLYELVVESQKGFADRFQAVLDASRLDLLDRLQAPRPVDSNAERAAWAALQQLSAGFRGPAFTFKPPPPPPTVAPTPTPTPKQ